MTRTFTQKITPSELAEKIWRAWRTHEDFEELRDIEEAKDSQRKERFSLGDILFVPYKNLTSRIEKDLNKVEFDTENMDAKPRREDEKNSVGLHTLKNGLSYLGVVAGGDWENPLFFAIYFDGKELRGYIPTEGNVWNPLNKTALGNDEDNDNEWLQRQGLKEIYEVSFDWIKIKQDLEQRIVYKEPLCSRSSYQKDGRKL